MSLSGKPKPITVFGRGRVCATDGCTTVLSRYNPSSRCALHQHQVTIVRLRRFESQEMEQRCEQCGARFVTSNPRRKYCTARCRSHAFAAREKMMREAVRRAEGRERLAA